MRAAVKGLAFLFFPTQPSESRWLKCLHKDSPELELGGGVCFHGQSSSDMEESDPPFSQELPRKRCQAVPSALQEAQVGTDETGAAC